MDKEHLEVLRRVVACNAQNTTEKFPSEAINFLAVWNFLRKNDRCSTGFELMTLGQVALEQAEAAEKQFQWEYCELSQSSSELGDYVAKLNALGAERWEAFDHWIERGDYSDVTHCFLLKRRKS